MFSLFVLIPLLSVIVLNLLSKRMRQDLAFVIAILVSLSQMIIVFFRQELFNFILTYDNLNQVVFLSIGLVVFIALIVGKSTIKNKKEEFSFMNLVLIALSGLNGIVVSFDIFTLYVFLEITAVCSFILIAINNNKHALEGSLKYIVLSAVATTMMLSAIALLLFISGDTSFVVIREALRHTTEKNIVLLAMSLFLCGMFIKGGLMPFHGWLPDAYSAAPGGVSVLLAGIVTKVSGVYVLMRIMLSVFSFNQNIKSVIMFVGALSIILGALSAIRQTDFKRMLAYSSISQVGYIVLALGCGSPLAIAAAVFHFFNHAVLKSLLFTNAIAVESRLSTTDMNKMGGLSTPMPFTAVSSTIGFLSVAGIPPFSGFWSKLMIIVALWVSGNYIYAVIAVLASVLTVAYFLALQRKVFFGKVMPGLENIKEVGFGLLFPQLVLAFITLSAGLFVPWVLSKFILPIQNLVH